MSTYTVSTTEYTDARALMGIANILDRMEKEVMPLDDEQVNALCFVVDAVRNALPTHWCTPKELADLHGHLRNLLVDLESVIANEQAASSGEAAHAGEGERE